MAKTDMKKGLAAVFGVPPTSVEEKLTGDSSVQTNENTSANTNKAPAANNTKKPAQAVKKLAKRVDTAATPKKPAKKVREPVKRIKSSIGSTNKTKEAVIDVITPTKEYKVAFNLQLPQSLHTRLSFYADNFAIGRKSSVTNIIITAIEQHLGDLEKKAGITK